MPKIKKELYDAQKRWEERIQRAKAVRKNWKELFKVDMAREYFDGKQMPPGVRADEWITINNVYSHLKAQLPALYAADPYFYIKLKKCYLSNPMMIAFYEKKGEIRQAYLNYLKEETDLKIKARLAIQDAHFAYGVMKSHYHADMVDNPDKGKPILNEETGNPMVDEETGDMLYEPDEIPIHARYCTTRVHPDDFLWDEDAGPLEESWAWVAQCIREPLAAVKKNKLFSKAATKKLQGKGESKDDEQKDREERKKGDIKGRGDSLFDKAPQAEDPEIVVRWEIYNIKKRTWLVIAENGEIPLLEEQPIPAGVERHPFSILRFTLRDDSPYPIPPVSQGLDPSREFNTLRSAILKHRKRFNRKYEVNETAVVDAETQLGRLETGDDGTIIRKRTGEQAVIPIQDAPLDQMYYAEVNYLKQDMIELFGGSHDESRGIAGAESATQAGILDKRLEIKEGDAMSMVIDFVRMWARKMDMLVQTHIDRDEAIRISGPNGEYWELVRTDDYMQIQGEFEYTVNVGATIPKMPQMERASWMAFLSLLANFPHLLGSQRLISKMAEMHHIEDELMLKELQKIWKEIKMGASPIPGKTGSQPGVGENRPVSAMGGQAGRAVG